MTARRSRNAFSLVIACVWLTCGGCGAQEDSARPTGSRGSTERSTTESAQHQEPVAPDPGPAIATGEPGEGQAAEAAGRPAGPLRVAMYRAEAGIAQDSFDETERLMRDSQGVAFTVITPESVAAGALAEQDVVIFTGGRGSIQGRLLGEQGRQMVRDFVHRGGGYVGVCAGAYLALQGRAEFYKLAMVAGMHTGDAWIRGVATVRIREQGSDEVHRIFYANGPVIHPVEVDGLSPYVPLASYLSDIFSPAHGTEPGQMPGSPAVLAARYGRGRLLLFSPNPVLAAPSEQPLPEMMKAAVRWVSDPGPIDPAITFDDVFAADR